jgi:hypothetical protein
VEGKDTLIMYPPGTQIGWPELAFLAWESGLKSGMSQSSRVNRELRDRLDSQTLNLICEKELSPKVLITIPNVEIQLVENCLAAYSDVRNLGGFTYISAQK